VLLNAEPAGPCSPSAARTLPGVLLRERTA
jgi:hypothetical protein